MFGSVREARNALGDAFSSEGEPVGRVMLPRSSHVFDARDGKVYLSENDELDVPYVVRFRIREG